MNKSEIGLGREGKGETCTCWWHGDTSASIFILNKHEKCLAYDCRKNTSTTHALYHSNPTEVCCQLQTIHSMHN